MIRVKFDNLEQLKQVYDPAIVEKAAKDATRRLSKRVGVEVSRTVRKRYAVKAGEVKSAVKTRFRRSFGRAEARLVYTAQRLSLPRFATGGGKPSRSNRPKIKTARGARYGAKVRVIKGRAPKLVRGAFWGRGRAGQSEEGRGAGAWQIWLREGPSRNSIRRLTGPSIAHMVRSDAAVESMNRTIGGEANTILASRLDFYMGRRAGVL